MGPHIFMEMISSNTCMIVQRPALVAQLVNGLQSPPGEAAQLVKGPQSPPGRAGYRVRAPIRMGDIDH